MQQYPLLCCVTCNLANSFFKVIRNKDSWKMWSGVCGGFYLTGLRWYAQKRGPPTALRSAYLDECAAFLPDLSGGLNVMVSLWLPDVDGLLCSALQQTRPGHQRRPDAGGAHVHSNIVDLCHEESS